MHRGDCGHAHGLEALMLEHLVVVLVDLDTPRLEVLLGPVKFLGVWRKSSDKLCSWCAVKKVVGVTSAHTAEAGDGNA